jgi:hypothetical protein
MNYLNRVIIEKALYGLIHPKKDLMLIKKILTPIDKILKNQNH